MAYTIAIDERCDSCNARAAYKVFNNRNGEIGKFCRKCADRKVKQLIELEDRVAKTS